MILLCIQLRKQNMLLYDPLHRTKTIESTFHYCTVQAMKEVIVSLYTLIVRMCNVFTCNLQNRKFIVLTEDGIHFIHARHHPKSSVTSTIWYMCTAVVDVHDNMRMVELEEDATMYKWPWRMAQSELVEGLSTSNTFLVLHMLKVETITAKASYNTSLCNSMNSTYQMLKIFFKK